MSLCLKILLSGKLKEHYQIDPKDSWLMEAAIRNLPIFVPGWEDSTLGNMYAAHCISGEVKNIHTVKTGIEYMILLAEWYTQIAPDGLGFFQIGGGIAGDFPICVVPMLHQDLRRLKFHFGHTFVKLVIQRQAMVHILVQCRMKKLPGASLARSPQNLSLNRTLPLLHH